MVFYKIEFALGVGLTTFGIIDLVLVTIAGQILSLSTIIPLIFLLGGTYLFYLTFKEVKLEKIKVNDLSANELKQIKSALSQKGKILNEDADSFYKAKMKRAEIKSITCPVCKSNLNVKLEENIFICQHCDTKFIINWI
ncbi:MAG: hypothetical protein EAX96_13215 [Candidatus Lokiarchaeota archaeon]|nr:hypothetical protein [Candidatus Lokiarchaeota archaeon]